MRSCSTNWGWRAKHQHRPLPRALSAAGKAKPLVSRGHRVGLGVEQAGEDDRAAGGEGIGKVGGEVDQRPGEDVGDDQVERRAGCEQRRVHPVRDGQQQFARTMAEGHAVDRGVVAGDVDRDRIDVGRDALGLRPQRQRGESEQAGAGSYVCNICENRTLAS